MVRDGGRVDDHSEVADGYHGVVGAQEKVEGEGVSPRPAQSLQKCVNFHHNAVLTAGERCT